MNDYKYKDDEIIIVKLPRAQYEILRTVLKREEAYNWVGNTLRSSWVWVAAGGLLSVIALWDTIKNLLIGVK